MKQALDEQVESFAPRLGTQLACLAFGVKERTFRYRRQVREGRMASKEALAAKPRERHPAALSSEERLRILDTLCSERFWDLPPAQVFHALLDEGTYLCSIRQMYRLLEDHGLCCERRRGGHQRRGLYPVPRLEANAPNQCWSWDITRLPGPARGIYYHLYTVIDIYSREVVGWTLATRECESVAKELIDTSCQRQGINPGELTLHADRGSPMIAGSLCELLDQLGVHKSHSRPRVSNDNPYSEAQFKTLKYRPDYPQRFASLTAAKAWCRNFFSWYSHSHYHSAIGYLRPADLHVGRHHDIVARRQEVLDKAYEAHPRRFQRRPKPADPPAKAWINKPTVQTR